MKSVIALSSLVLATIHASAALSLVIDLETAKKTAIGNNYGLSALRHEYTESESRFRGNDSSFLPTIGITAGAEAKRTNPSDQYTFGYLSGAYNIFNGYRDTYNRDMLSNEMKEIQERLRAQEFLVELDVEEWFKTYLFKEEYIKLKNEDIRRNEEHKRLVNLSRRKGQLSDTDVMEFQLQEAKIRSDLVSLNQELDDALSNLRGLLGPSIGENIKLSGRLSHQHIRESLEDITGSMGSANLAIRKKEIELETAKIDRKISDNRWLPSVDLEARAGALPPSEREDGVRLDTHVLLAAKMILYNGGETKHEQFAKAEKQLRLEYELLDQQSKTRRAIEISYRSLKGIESRTDLEKDNADFAGRYYRSVLSEYKRGFKNSPDLNAASEKLSEALQRQVELESSFMKQRIELERELGRHISVKEVM